MNSSTKEISLRSEENLDDLEWNNPIVSPIQHDRDSLRAHEIYTGYQGNDSPANDPALVQKQGLISSLSPSIFSSQDNEAELERISLFLQSLTPQELFDEVQRLENYAHKLEVQEEWIIERGIQLNILRENEDTKIIYNSSNDNDKTSNRSSSRTTTSSSSIIIPTVPLSPLSSPSSESSNLDIKSLTKSRIT